MWIASKSVSTSTRRTSNYAGYLSQSQKAASAAFFSTTAKGVICIEPDGFLTPIQTANATVVEKKSEFIAQLAPVNNEEQALDFLAQVRAAHRTARHHVYAYVLRQDGRTRYSDDGEPAKTAGLPVLSAIQHAHLQDCIIVVTRYFGGTLLGTGGLVRAYTAAAEAAIKAASIASICPVRHLTLHLPYPAYDNIRRTLDDAGAHLLGEPTFADSVTLRAQVLATQSDALCLRLAQILRGDDGIIVSDILLERW